MSSPWTVVITSSCSLLLIYQSWKDERLSWPSWLTYSRRFTHISGHPSAVGPAQDSESSPVKDQRPTAAPQNQPSLYLFYVTDIHCKCSTPALPWQPGRQITKTAETHKEQTDEWKYIYICRTVFQKLCWKILYYFTKNEKKRTKIKLLWNS